MSIKRFAFLLIAVSAFGQGSRKDDIALKASGAFPVFIPSASVRVCNSGSTGTPCTPTATLYSDSTLGSTVGNPITADAQGNYHIYSKPGRYDLQITDPSSGAVFTQKDVILAPDVANIPDLITSSTPVVDVRAYGADATGVSDSKAAFQAAITAATNGGTVFVPCGTFSFTTSFAMAAKVRLKGAQKQCTILKFTGATDGITIADAVNDWGIEDLTVQTSNASAGKAIVANGSVGGITFFRIANVAVTATGLGRFTHGFYCSFCEVATVTDLKVFQAATIGYYLVTNSNQLNIINPEVTGGQPADATYNRGLWIDTPGTDGPNIFGGTFQGCFSLGSAVFISGHSPRLYGLHAEGTCAAADGGDLIINGASETQVFGGQVVQQTVLTGTIRGFLASGVNMEGAVTIGASVQGACLRDGRAFSITDNGTIGSVTNNGNCWTNMRNSSGALLRDKGIVEKDSGSSASTASFPTNAAVSYPNNTEIHFRDSGGTSQRTLFVTNSDGWFLQYKATKSFVFRNSTPTTIMTLFDTGINTPLQFTSSLATGTAPFSIASTTNTPNLNASILTGSGTAAGLTGTGACATITTQSGGAIAGQATCTGTTGASTFIVTPGLTAPHGWVCYAQDQTTRANLLQQTANNATTCTLTATSVTQNDVVVFSAIAF